MSSSTVAMIIGLLIAEQKMQKQLFISKKVPQHLSEQHLRLLDELIQNVHDVITRTSALPGYEHNALAVAESRKKIDTFIFEKIKTMTVVQEKLLFKLICSGIKAQAAGNCREFAIYMCSLLFQEIPSEIYRGKGGDASHVFLVINRNPSTPTHDFTQWNTDTIIVDPYLKMIYLAHEIPELLQICIHDAQENTIHYIPFNQQQHTLDNNIRAELLEDWQNALQRVKENNRSNSNTTAQRSSRNESRTDSAIAEQRNSRNKPKTDSATEEQQIISDSSYPRS